ncbi:MAG TPA: hypothetical protein VMZ03_02400 [Chitinophagaceae bacterium]|nr:hypothetical protein [Chitinophagaceae bacterium]
MKRLLLVSIPLLFLITSLAAQDTLPRFSVINAGNNRVIIGWINKLENVKQISIQRSFDSLTGYKTILTVADPTLPQNGLMDAKATNDHMFYRLYIMLDKGMYLFSDAKKPVKDSLRTIIKTNVQLKNDPSIPDSVEKARPVVIQLNGFPGTDSVTVPIPVNMKNKTNSFVPSLYVYTCRDGYVCIKLPDDEKPKKYSIKFFENERLLFELKEIKEKEFKLDKTNFYHAGWFNFELYEEGNLVEKHKFYLEKDF